MTDKYDGKTQPDFMSDETFTHFKIVRDYPLYWETRSWHPILIGRQEDVPEAIDWLEARGAKRCDTVSRNDYLHPITRFFLIRDTDLAVEFRLRWA